MSSSSREEATSTVLATFAYTVRSRTAVSHSCGLTPFNAAVRMCVAAFAQLSPPPSLPANSAALCVTTTGRICAAVHSCLHRQYATDTASSAGGIAR